MVVGNTINIMDSADWLCRMLKLKVVDHPKFVDIRSKYEFSWKQAADGWL